MQTTGTRVARSVRSVMAGALIGAVTVTNALADSDRTLVTQSILIGITESVRKELRDSVSPFSGRVPLKRSRQVEFDSPPPLPCGWSVYERFVTSLQTTFNVSILDSCTVSDDKVSCQTHYLGGYPRVYLSLSYTYRAESEMELLLEARQRSPDGDVSSGGTSLSERDQFAVVTLFNALFNKAHCNGKDVPK